MSQSYKPSIRTFTAEGAITAKTFVKMGTADGKVAQCGDGEKMVGVCMNVENVANGEKVEVALPGGGCRIKLGATVARGEKVASGAGGVADAGTAADRSGAILFESGVAGDIVDAVVSIGTI